MADILDNFRVAYQVLEGRVTRALRTQLGDEDRLREQQNHVLLYRQSAEQHRNVFPAEEFAILEQSISEMMSQLDSACFQSTDMPDGPSLVISQRASTGKRGRPTVQIEPNFLAQALELRGPTHLASVFNCSSRTIRRRAVELGLAEPGVPIYTDTEEHDGTVTRSYNSTSKPVSTLTDEQLDQFMLQILEVFPNFGRRMIEGRLKSAGHPVTRERIAASFLRVHGTPGVFGDRTIHRKIYKVGGANSLAHHDGQHGLIRFKIVIHCFIDGKSRYVTGIRASNNNRSATVLDLFMEVINQHGVPSRVRGDHGTENLLVAQWMDDNMGVDRGSYIWGRSVHNTRIERLWYDVTHGFGQKWKNFFIDLEMHHGLLPTNTAHIWLLHHLFLVQINADAQEWAHAWNSHTLQIRGERDRSPRDMFLFSMVQDGPRGIQQVQRTPADEPLDDPSAYGIDWEVADDPTLMNHLLTQNPAEWEHDNPFTVGPAAGSLSHVECEPPGSPFTSEQITHLDQRITLSGVNLASRSMATRRLLWEEALEISQELYQVLHGTEAE